MIGESRVKARHTLKSLEIALKTMGESLFRVRQFPHWKSTHGKTCRANNAKLKCRRVNKSGEEQLFFPKKLGAALIFFRAFVATGFSRDGVLAPFGFFLTLYAFPRFFFRVFARVANRTPSAHVLSGFFSEEGLFEALEVRVEPALSPKTQFSPSSSRFSPAVSPLKCREAPYRFPAGRAWSRPESALICVGHV